MVSEHEREKARVMKGRQGQREERYASHKNLQVAGGILYRTSITIAVSPSSMSALASRISLRQHVGLLRNVHKDLADTVSSLFSDKSRTCIHTRFLLLVLTLSTS